MKFIKINLLLLNFISISLKIEKGFASQNKVMHLIYYIFTTALLIIIITMLQTHVDKL